MPRVRCARVTKARQTDESRFVRRTLIAVGIAAAAFLAWELRGVLALVFGAVLIATIIRAIGKPLQDYLKLPERLAVMTAVLVIVGAIGVTIWLIGSQVVAQSHSRSASRAARGSAHAQRSSRRVRGRACCRATPDSGAKSPRRTT